MSQSPGRVRPFRNIDPKTGSIIIDVSIRRLTDFYNSLDASPDFERDLSENVSAYLRNAVEDMTPRERQKAVICLYLDRTVYEPAETRENMVQALRNYFNKRRDAEKRKYRYAMIRGRRMLIRGMIFLVTCLVASSVFLKVTITNDLSEALSQSFVVIGWVALWKPIEFYLYDRKEITDELSELETICRMPVFVLPSDQKDNRLTPAEK